MNSSNSLLHKQSQTSKSVCILQLTRAGDLIQTLQAAKDYLFFHPETKFDLIARYKISQPILFLLETFYENIFYIDEFSASDYTQECWSARSHLYDEVINLSFSPISAKVAATLKATSYKGLTLDSDGKISVSDRWSTYFYGSVNTGSYNPFHIIDLFRFIIGETRSRVKISTLEDIDFNKILLHPFASLERKRWSADKWADVTSKILSSLPDCQIILVGGKEDEQEALELVNHSILRKLKNRVTNLVGSTSLEDLWKSLPEIDFFLGHDSLVGNLCALKDIPCLTVALGCVRPWETTPYASHSFSLRPSSKCFPCFPDETCSYYQCHYDISSSCISEIISDLSAPNSTRISQSQTILSKDTGLVSKSLVYDGIIFHSLLGGNNAPIGEIVRTVYFIAWNFFLNDIEINLPLPKISESGHSSLLKLTEGLKYCYELFEFGKRYSKYILDECLSLTPNIKNVKDNSLKLSEIEELLIALKSTYPELSPVVAFGILERSNFCNVGIKELAYKNFSSYNEGSLLCNVIFDLLTKLISENKQLLNIRQKEILGEGNG